jgi:branched-chain amino acid transport system substrate-binding protein
MLNEPMPQFLSTPEATEFLDAYKKAYNELPGSIWAVYAADGVNALAAAVAAAGTDSDTTKIVAAMRGLSGVKGITGELLFDERGDRRNVPYQLYEYNAAGELSPHALP